VLFSEILDCSKIGCLLAIFSKLLEGVIMLLISLLVSPSSIGLGDFWLGRVPSFMSDLASKHFVSHVGFEYCTSFAVEKKRKLKMKKEVKHYKLQQSSF
jgi:hypothetical protein